jgi:hypothetical protein
MRKKDKLEVRERAKYCCEYCMSQEEFSMDIFSIEHIIPIVKGGSNLLSNLALSCQGCNSFKHIAVEVIDIVTGNKVSLYNPRADEWSHHFEWSKDYSLMFGKTAVGRATIIRLRLNRKGLVKLRGVFAAAGLHPPY